MARGQSREASRSEGVGPGQELQSVELSAMARGQSREASRSEGVGSGKELQSVERSRMARGQSQEASQSGEVDSGQELQSAELSKMEHRNQCQRHHQGTGDSPDKNPRPRRIPEALAGRASSWHRESPESLKHSLISALPDPWKSAEERQSLKHSSISGHTVFPAWHGAIGILEAGTIISPGRQRMLRGFGTQGARPANQDAQNRRMPQGMGILALRTARKPANPSRMGGFSGAPLGPSAASDEDPGRWAKRIRTQPEREPQFPGAIAHSYRDPGTRTGHVRPQPERNPHFPGPIVESFKDPGGPGSLSRRELRKVAVWSMENSDLARDTSQNLAGPHGILG